MKHKSQCIPQLAYEEESKKWFLITDYIKHRNGVKEIVKDYDITDQMNKILNNLDSNKQFNQTNYSFPATKWVKTATVKEQLEHVRSEFREMITAESQECLTCFTEEAVDLYHSLETLFRVMQRENIPIPYVFEKVEAKNRGRGYYAD
jgi:cell division protein FtsX